LRQQSHFLLEFTVLSTQSSYGETLCAIDYSGQALDRCWQLKARRIDRCQLWKLKTFRQMKPTAHD